MNRFCLLTELQICIFFPQKYLENEVDSLQSGGCHRGSECPLSRQPQAVAGPGWGQGWDSLSSSSRQEMAAGNTVKGLELSAPRG